MQPHVRNPSNIWDVLTLVRMMTGEVRVRAREEEVELRMLPTLTNRVAPNLEASSSSIIPTAAGMEGYTRKLCARFGTDQGCPLQVPI
eukprot:12916956-Prorocentrum_lima.AAC.1